MAPITTVGFVTADRPAMVRRALESCISHCELHKRRPRFLVVDGSRTATNRHGTRAAVAVVTRATGHNIRYIGPHEAANLANSLRRAGASAADLSTRSIGAGRNVLLLLAAGERMLMIDDDVLCDVWSKPGRNNDVVVTGHRDLRETSHFPTRAAVLASISRSDADLFAEHEALLGRTLRKLIADSPQPPDLTSACSHVRAALEDGRPQLIKVTMTGLAGDAATYGPDRILFRTVSEQHDVWTSRQAFETATRSRELSRVVLQRVVTHNSHCMAVCMGLFNQAGVPPFPPIARNEDGVFGALLAAGEPTSLFGHIPVGVVHDSHRPSKYTGDRMISASQSRISELITNLVFRYLSSVDATSPVARMRNIGDLLIGVGRISRRRFVALASDVTSEARRREFAWADHIAAAPGCPSYWSEALKRYRARYANAARKPRFIVPVEFQTLASIDECFDATQAFVKRFGELMVGWPDLWEAARQINGNRRRSGI